MEIGVGAEVGIAAQSKETVSVPVAQRPVKDKVSEVMRDPSRLSWETVMPRIQKEKADGKTIVVTNGHFALLHPGHLLSFEEARTVGREVSGEDNDSGVILLTIVNNDSQTQAKDPAKAAALNAQNRAVLVYQMSDVDYAVVSEAPVGDQSVTTDIQRLAQAEIIDHNFVYVKGADYGTETNVPPEARVVQEHGGRFVIVYRQEGLSTSDQMQAIEAELRKKGRL